MKNFLQWFFDKHNKETLRQHLVRGTLWSFVIKALSTFLVFLISVVLARLLGPDGLGQYAFAIALVQLLVLPGTLGTPQLIVREVSAKALSSSWGEIRGLLRRVNQSTLVISILLVLLGFSLTWYFGESEERQSMYVIWLALLLIPMRVVTRIKTALIRGLRHVVLSQIPMLLFRPLLFLIFLLIFHWVCDDVLKTNTAILFQIMATGLALVTILA
ncbi:MAG TPA: oligosaccharide flippase family protein, partial [Desulfohalobiaceae bacterium]|nr:oligosaccharide flippase family protein [Desulfohalobiaceae bacterium]